MNFDSVNISIDETAIDEALTVRPADIEPATELTYAKNVFIPLTTACRYTCTYCTYYDPPGQASLLTPTDIREIVERGVKSGCTEALFTFGDDPDDRYNEIHAQLDELGHGSIHEYLAEACDIALDAGLLPHSNPGDQTHAQMSLISERNASMGVMLETTADVQAHQGPRAKSPTQRVHTLETAGKLEIPFTTGILVGIGEQWRDRAESLLAIAQIHDQYDHIQEVIIQPVSNNERWQEGSPSTETMRRVTAMARATLPAEISIQSPPNLAPVRDLLDCGIDDLGGISPVTTDHINPDYAWPAVRELEDIASEAGVPLRERLPVYESYLNDAWLSPRVQQVIRGDNTVGTKFRSIASD
jgi:FO synthase subunit 1